MHIRILILIHIHIHMHMHIQFIFYLGFASPLGTISYSFSSYSSSSPPLISKKMLPHTQ